MFEPSIVSVSTKSGDSNGYQLFNKVNAEKDQGDYKVQSLSEILETEELKLVQRHTQKNIQHSLEQDIFLTQTHTPKSVSQSRHSIEHCTSPDMNLSLVN
jgi:hypothetical protein